MEKQIKYCSQCGNKIEGKLVGAETVFVKYFNLHEGYELKLAEPFDIETGKRNMAYKFICPKQEKGFFSLRHDNYAIEKVVQI